jgi:hypothetical protein
MALSSPNPSPRDRKEFARMVAEKNAAFGESWMAMAAQAALANQALAASFFRSFLAAATARHLLPQHRQSSFTRRPSEFSTRVSRRFTARPLPTPSAFLAPSFAELCR